VRVAPSPLTTLEPLLAALRAGATADRTRTFAARADLAATCLRRLDAHADRWVAAACAAKGIDLATPAAADEWAGGPLPVARQLRCLLHTMRSLARGRLPPLHSEPGTGHVRAAPRGLLDRLALPGYRAVVEVEPGPLQHEPPSGGQGVHVVLGAGNVASMPVGDALHAIFQRGAAVLLKLSPLHADLLPVFGDVLAPLVEADLLRLCVGDATVGRAAVLHGDVAAWHLTGAPATLRALLAEPAARQKAWTAELGNVTPVAIVPGRWRSGELRAAARQIAAWFAQNAACNCITPRLLLCAAAWPQRSELLAALRAEIARLPPRVPFHPGARERFERFAAQPAAGAALPFVLREAVDLLREPHLAGEESFAPVLCTVDVPGDGALAFAQRVSALLREQVFGALAAHIVAPRRVLAAERRALDHLLQALPHGTIAINTWAAVGYALMATPWGTGAHAQGERNGRGFVHGTLCLRAPVRTIVSAPLQPWPPPPWLSSRGQRGLVRALCRVHARPSPARVLALFASALRHRGTDGQQ